MADWLPGPTSSVLQKAASGYGHGYGVGTSFDRYLSQLQQVEQQAYLSNLQRKEQIESIYDSIIEMYQPGGAFEARYLSQLGTRKAKDVGSEMQQLISSGLYGTTTTAGLGRRWEAEVGEPSRLAMEDIMQQRLGMAMGKKAEFLTGIEEEYPDYATAATLAAQAASARGGGAAVSAGGGYSSGGAGGFLTGSAGPAWVQEAAARMARGEEFFPKPGSQRRKYGGSFQTQSQAQTRTQRKAYEQEYGGKPPIQMDDIIWGEEEAAKLLAEKMVPTTAEAIPTATKDIMSRYPATKSGPYKGGTIGTGKSRYVWTGSYYKHAPV